ncbi:uncharacterized protein LOC143256637 [Tachypleus tridentatus]|uniref:uncharacterized protein LOC143256637 n=1 Tax=Tachypleus tridentatus TaxID=6853 RepID=UPI003FD0A461
MQCLRGSPGIMVLLFYIQCLWTEVSAMCPMRCKCDDQSLRVVCENANLDVVPITLNPELRELILKNNHIKSIMASFSVYHNLEYLDVSHNQLVDLGEHNFKMQQHLCTLYLSRNMVSLIHNNSFAGLHQLKVLYLNENFLEDIPSRAFVHLPNLKALDLSQNRIAIIAEDGFYGLGNIRTLLLRDNKLDYIPLTAFQDLPTLIKLDFGLNAIEEVPKGAFKSLRHLEELSLDGCGLVKIESGGFQHLHSVIVLNLQDNELQEIPTRALADVHHLEELNIGQNKFQELKPLSFQRLKHLRVVKINGSPHFTSIHKDAFLHNIYIKKLLIAHNRKLDRIDHHTFDGLLNLRYVSLRGNAFTTFQYDLLPWDKLEVFDIRDNPLFCNCKMLWLQKLLSNHNITSGDSRSVADVHCASPPVLKNVLLTEVTDEDLGCYIEVRRQQIIIGIIVSAVTAVGVLIFLGICYRKKLNAAFKSKWASGRNEPQYQKTLEEENIAVVQRSIKMTPTTEL